MQLLSGHYLMETILQHKEILIYERLDKHRKNGNTQIEKYLPQTTIF